MHVLPIANGTLTCTAVLACRRVLHNDSTHAVEFNLCQTHSKVVVITLSHQLCLETPPLWTRGVSDEYSYVKLATWTFSLSHGGLPVEHIHPRAAMCYRVRT